MNLFKDITIKQKLSTFNIPDFDKKIDIIQTWADDYHHGSLKTDKETSRAGGYNQAIFSDILGYVRKPSPRATFDAEYSLQGKFPDGVLGHFHTDEEKEDNVCAVVELKGANIPLDQPQKREKNYTPIEQGFGYKRLLRNCPFVIVSNFYELRLYNDNEIDYEIWTLDDLLDSTDDYFNFKKFYYLLCADHLIAETGSSKTELLMSDIRLEEQAITKKFYSDYKQRRHWLLQNLYQKNVELRDNPDLLIEMGQKLIDRVIFMCFAEDRGLLPPDILQTIKRDFEKSSMVATVWDSLKIAFNYVNKGNENWGIPDGYNGGLFARDDRFDDLKVDGHILSKIIDLGMYDFADQLSVTILGHIFEQSISDLEEIKEKIEDFGKEKKENTEAKTSKRKKDGIFYTPEYIVDYIVKNSLGAYLREHETKLIEQENLHDELSEREYQKREQIVYTKYQEFLKTIKVLDPACGSGAFLVRVFDYLLEENRRVGKILGGLFNNDEIYKDILQNNIYGVDLNAESVEITKLSLWLKSAQKGKKLSNLDNNIKCGNSLIDDPAVAGDKAFKWEEEFADIMNSGGFDVIVGNPPYVRQELLNKDDKNYLSNKYESGNGTADLYVYFYEKAINILKQHGKLAFITPNKFYKTKYGKELRILLKQYNLISLIDFFELSVFEDASTDSQILVLEKNNNRDSFEYVPIKNLDSFRNGNYIRQSIDKNNLDDDIWVFYSEQELTILNKMKQNSISLREYTNNGIEYGIKTGLNEAFIIDKKTKDEIIKNDIKSAELIKPYISGIDIGRYHINNKDELYFINTYYDLDISLYPGIYKWLENFDEKLQKRQDKGVHHYNLRACRYYDKFDKPKILYIHTAVNHKFYYDEEGYYINNSSYFISNTDKFLSVWLNSKIFSFYKKLNFVAYGDSSGSGRAKLDYNKMVNVPIPNISENQKKPFIEKADTMLDLNKKFYEQSARFLQRMIDNYGLEKANKKIEKFWELEFGDFVKEMRKKGANVPLPQQDELQDYFEEKKPELLDLDNQIKTTDAEIDQMVYELYGLTDEEIKIIENS